MLLQIPTTRNVINGKVSWEGTSSTSQIVQLQFFMDAKRLLTVYNLGSLRINDLPFSQIFMVWFFFLLNLTIIIPIIIPISKY